MKTSFKSAAIASIALLVTLGATAASAAPLVYTKAALINGWTYYDATTVRQPTYAIDADGIVHLRGGMRQTSGSNPLAFVLPVDLRPNKDLYLTTNLNGGVLGRFHILPDGSVNVIAVGPATYADAQEFTNLDGVEFSHN